MPARHLFAQTILPDSLSVVRDSVIVAGSDTLSTPQDSLIAPPSDSLAAGKVLTPKEARKQRRDSIKMVKDSIRRATPRILETCAIPESLYYKRMLIWNSDPYFNKVKLVEPDTTFNDWYTEYPFFKEDVNATYLGVIGSATQNFNYFKRHDFDIAPFYSYYLPYTYTAESMRMYNVKSPCTELAYWGTLFSYKDKEESSARFMHTQNITPHLNLQLEFHMFGGKGILSREATNNRTFTLTGNYLGERYVANGGFISNTIKRDENGGIVNTSDVRDTTFDAKTIAINLNQASNRITKRTFFLNHSYGIPIRFKKQKDSLGRDTLDAGAGTMAYFGHSFEYSFYTKFYSDQIARTDTKGREFYYNNFFIHPYQSADSMRVSNLDNKLFFRLQPWSSDAIVSQIEGGAGYQHLTYYTFSPDSYLQGHRNIAENNLYVYAGANGKFRKYFSWDAFGKYNLAGYNIFDYRLGANATFSFYPFSDKKEPISLTASFNTSATRPDYYTNNIYSNHFIWSNDFDKTFETKIEGELNIPKWKMSAFFGYALVNNHIYYDTLGIVQQHPETINVMSAYLQKDLKAWLFHFDNQVLFQLSSNNDVLPLPLVALHLRYYIEYELVKKVLTVQVGADGTFTTAYFAPAYNPATGQFHNQNFEKVGNCPYIDVFANFQWKQATLFFKFTNANQGWPNGDYFSAYHYAKPRRAFKFGIYWPFHIH